MSKQFGMANTHAQKKRSEVGSNKHRCFLDIKQYRVSLVKLSLDENEDDDNHVVIKILIVIIIPYIVAVSCSGSILINL